MAGSKRSKNVDMSKADPRIKLLTKGAGIPKRNLKSELKSREITTEAFAAMMGLSDHTTVSKWISGARYMSDEGVVDASVKLSCSPMYLLDLTNDKMPKYGVTTVDDFSWMDTHSYRRKAMAKMVDDASNPIIKENEDSDCDYYSIAEIDKSNRRTYIVRRGYYEERDEQNDVVRRGNYEVRHGCKHIVRGNGEFESKVLKDPDGYKKSLIDTLMDEVRGDYRDLGGISHLLLDRINASADERADEILNRLCSSLLGK